MMKVFSLSLFLLVLNVTQLFGQQKEIPKDNKWGYVDTNFILQQMPDYQKAQKEIDQISAAWRLEMKEKFFTIDSLYQDFNQQAVLLSTEEKDLRRSELKAMEDSLATYRKEVFGFDGLFFQKKKEILKTVQDRLFDAIEIVAKENQLHTVFDKAQDQNIIYVHPIHDYSDYVLEKLGLGDPNDRIR